MGEASVPASPLNWDIILDDDASIEELAAVAWKTSRLAILVQRGIHADPEEHGSPHTDDLELRMDISKYVAMAACLVARKLGVAGA